MFSVMDNPLLVTVKTAHLQTLLHHASNVASICLPKVGIRRGLKRTTEVTSLCGLQLPEQHINKNFMSHDGIYARPYLISSTVSAYMGKGDFASWALFSRALPHSIKDTTASR